MCEHKHHVQENCFMDLLHLSSLFGDNLCWAAVSIQRCEQAGGTTSLTNCIPTCSVAEFVVLSRQMAAIHTGGYRS